MFKKILLGLGVFVLVSGLGIGVAYAANPEEIQGAAARLTQVFVTNWPSNQNVTITNPSPIPVSIGSTLPDAQVIHVYGGQVLTAGQFMDSEYYDIAGYRKVTLMTEGTGGNYRSHPIFSPDGEREYNMSTILGNSIVSYDVMGPKIKVRIWNENPIYSTDNVQVHLYLTK